jgi:hypothetical protein
VYLDERLEPALGELVDSIYACSRRSFE